MLNSLVSFYGEGTAAGGGTSFESIATVNGDGSTATITFSSIPSTYSHLQLRWTGRSLLSDSSYESVQIRLNGDTGSNYSQHWLQRTPETDFNAGGAGTYTYFEAYAPNNTNGNDSFATGILDILDYKNTNKYKTARHLYGWQTNGGSYVSTLSLRSGSWRNTSAITSITIYGADGAWKTGSKFALYGIK